VLSAHHSVSVSTFNSELCELYSLAFEFDGCESAGTGTWLQGELSLASSDF